MADLSLGKAVLELATDEGALVKGLDQAKSKAEGWSAGVSGMGKMGALAIAGVTAAVATVTGTLMASAVAVARDAGEIAKLKRELGLTADQSSRLVYEGKRLNLDTDQLSASFGKFNKFIVSNKGDLSEYRIEVVKTKDGHIDFEATLGNTADRFKAMPDGVEKSALAMELFGKTGKDMIPLLNKGSDGLKAMGDEAAKLGLVFDDKALASAKRLSLAHKDLDDRMEGLRNRIGIAFLPMLADWTGSLVTAADVVLPKVSAALETLTGWGQSVADKLKGPASEGLKAIAGVVDTVLRPVGELKDILTGVLAPEAWSINRLIGEDRGAQVIAVFMHVRDSLRALPGLIAQVAGSIGEIFDVATGRRPEAGGMLRSLVGDEKAMDIMGVVGRVREAMKEAFDLVKPIVQGVIDKVGELKTKFDELPPAIQGFAAAAVVGQVTGFNEQLLSMASNAAQAGAGAIALAKSIGIMGLAMSALGLDGLILQVMYFGEAIGGGALAIGGFVVAAAPFILLAAATGVAIYLLITHWNELGDTLSMIGAIIGHFAALAGEAIGGFFSGVGSAVQSFIGFWVGAWQMFSERPAYYIGLLVGFVFGQLLNLAQGIADFAGGTVATIVSWGGQMLDGIGKFLGSIGTAWSQFWSGDMPLQLLEGAGQIVLDVLSFLGELKDTVVKGIGDLLTWWWDTWWSLPGKMLDIGKAIVEGVWNGITGAAAGFMKNVRDFLAGLVDGAKDALGIRSPSAVMAAIGFQIVAGLAQGIADNAPLVEDALTGVTGRLMSLLDGAIAKWRSGTLTSSVEIANERASALTAVAGNIAPGQKPRFWSTGSHGEQVPIFHQGGVMPHTGLAVLKAGEVVTPADRISSALDRMGGAGHGHDIYMDGQLVAQAVDDRQSDRIAMLGGRMR